ncbi:MAG: hypothetical protein PHF00_08440 [Elusimicrobia bacterium]|nr:hypothetical protein [Elusimicrobiota bacterium]
MAALAAAVLTLGLFRASGLGFYNDDYVLVAAMDRPGSFFAALRGLSAGCGGLFSTRPLDLPYYAGLYALFGLRPLGYALFSIALQLALAWNFYRLLREWYIPTEAALLGALLAGLHPSHDSTRLWVSASIATTSLLGTVLALRLHNRWLERRDRAAQAAALAVFGAATLVYEAAAPLVLLAAWMPLRRARRQGLSWPRAAKQTLGSCAALWSFFILIVAYQRLWIPWSSGLERHPMSLNPSHVLKVVASGLECSLGNRLLHLISRQASFALDFFGPPQWALLILAVAALAWLCIRLLRRAPALDSWTCGLGAAWFLLGYAPYFLDRTYTPSIFDLTNRINLASSFGAALILAWAFSRLRDAAWPAARLAAPALLAVLVSGFLLAGWSSNAQWSRAYSLQREVLRSLTAEPQGSRPGPVLVFGVPGGVGSATVFSSGYDLDCALLLQRPPSPLKAHLAQGVASFEPRAAVVGGFRGGDLPYANLRAYDHGTGTWTDLKGPKDGLSLPALRRL